MYQVFQNDAQNMLTITASGMLKERELQEVIELIAGTIERSGRDSLNIVIRLGDCRFTMWQLPYLYKIKKLARYPQVRRLAIQITENLHNTYRIPLGVQDFENFGVFMDESQLQNFLM